MQEIREEFGERSDAEKKTDTYISAFVSSKQIHN